MYTVFICRKCEHELYVKDVEDMGAELGEIAVMDCPNCGEEGYDNWILSCRKRRFPDDKTCGDCRYFLGGGDWALCCDKHYDLYFSDSKACDDFDEKECES